MSTTPYFHKLLQHIQPTSTELTVAKRHIAEIKVRLLKTVRLKNLFAAGSYARQSLIRGTSDVDLFAVIARDEVRWGHSVISSFTVLDRFRNELIRRYPLTSVGRDANAMRVSFSQGPKVDVVPSVFHKMAGKRPEFLIPDGAGGWMPTSPPAHNRYIKMADERSGGKLKYVAQILKFWRTCSNTRAGLSSFHIEMLLATSGICEGARSYATCITQALARLASRQCRGIYDPLGISGLIPAVKSESQRSMVLTSVRRARDHAQAACIAEAHGDLRRAWIHWNTVFNRNFPR